MSDAAPQLIARDGRTIAPEHTDSPLAIHGLTVSYGEKPVLFSVDFVTPPGSMVAIVGPNGAGKSTLIKAALGIVPRVSGEVTTFGKPYAEVRHRTTVYETWGFAAGSARGNAIMNGCEDRTERSQRDPQDPHL